MPSRDILDCVPELQRKWPLLREAFSEKFPGHSLELTCTHRSPEEQFALFQKGRRQTESGEWLVDDPKAVVTQIDGKTRLSNHNYKPARAFDVAIQKPDGNLTWDLTDPTWQALPGIVSGLGLISGGQWVQWKDFPHVEADKSAWV